MDAGSLIDPPGLTHIVSEHSPDLIVDIEVCQLPGVI